MAPRATVSSLILGGLPLTVAVDGTRHIAHPFGNRQPRRVLRPHEIEDTLPLAFVSRKNNIPRRARSVQRRADGIDRRAGIVTSGLPGTTPSPDLAATARSLTGSARASLSEEIVR